MSFDVAAVKPANADVFRAPGFPLDDEDAFKQTGGRFLAIFPLLTYVNFTYKVGFAPDQRRALLAHLRKRAEAENFEIEASTPQSNVPKDQLRLMRQSLLVERFSPDASFRDADCAGTCAGAGAASAIADIPVMGIDPIDRSSGTDCTISSY